ncbi:MAG: hypothetical protein AAF492_02580, partial [Verrucomicrobiota bacterium]
MVIHQESFESPPLGTNYTVIGEYWDGGSDYFIRTDNTFANYPTHPTNPDGSFYFVTRDTASAGPVPPQPPGGTAIVTIASVPVAAWENLQVRLAVQDADQGFDAVSEGAMGDFVRVLVVADGVTSLVGQVTGTIPNDDTLYDDINLDGIGDVGATATTSDFTDFNFSIPGRPNNITVIIEARVDFGTERLAFDNLRLLGDSALSVISNGSPTAVTDSSAILNAGFDGSGEIYDVFVYWGPTDGGSNAGLWANSALIGNYSNQASTNLSHPIGGLSPNMETFFTWRVINATNATEEIWSRPSGRFTTFGPPVVDNGGGAVPFPAEADLQGNLLGGDSADVTIYWGETDGGTTPGAWDASVHLGVLPTGPFLTTVTNLLYGRPFFYRTYATNAFGEDWADASTSFATVQPPGVGTINLPAFGLTTTSAILNADFNGMGSMFDVTLFWGPGDGGTDASA